MVFAHSFRNQLLRRRLLDSAHIVTFRLCFYIGVSEKLMDLLGIKWYCNAFYSIVGIVFLVNFVVIDSKVMGNCQQMLVLFVISVSSATRKHYKYG
jgi:hypothetical protein